MKGHPFYKRVTITSLAVLSLTLVGWAGARQLNLFGLASDAVGGNYTLTTSTGGRGSGTVTPSSTYPAGTSVTITATPAAGSSFGGWNDGACWGRKLSCTIKMDKDQTANANFNVIPNLPPILPPEDIIPKEITIKVGVDGYGDYSGTITSNLPGISCGSDCSEKYPKGSSVTLTATPGEGSRFITWTHGLCPNTNVCTLPVESLAVSPTSSPLNAIFEKIPTGGGAGGGTGGTASYSWKITKSGTGSGTVTSSQGGISCGSDCIEFYDSGVFVTLTATPDAGSKFASWNDGVCSGNKTTCTKVTNGNKQANAVFVKL